MTALFKQFIKILISAGLLNTSKAIATPRRFLFMIKPGFLQLDPRTSSISKVRGGALLSLVAQHLFNNLIPDADIGDSVYLLALGGDLANYRDGS